ncbi:MAG TPA: 3-hydroxyacyl-CoA dehydrogenase NAD-binding domain-containing protein, partial [Sphingorhabdus sp.]|nr:3-hydroxyacyl-CoA dehydrogenase NAD-binding domain-containing protein [Sphingorhabdus sp.]
MRAVGVIGAGQMGAGIAQVSAGAGYHVYLSDLDLEKAEAGKAGIGKALDRLVAKEKMGREEADMLLSRVEPVASYEPMAGAGLIIEAATER